MPVGQGGGRFNSWTATRDTCVDRHGPVHNKRNGRGDVLETAVVAFEFADADGPSPTPVPTPSPGPMPTPAPASVYDGMVW